MQKHDDHIALIILGGIVASGLIAGTFYWFFDTFAPELGPGHKG